MKRNKKQAAPNNFLYHQILQSKIALDTAYAIFEYATEPDLIDCSIYELKAAQSRYRYLLTQAKQRNIPC